MSRAVKCQAFFFMPWRKPIPDGFLLYGFDRKSPDDQSDSSSGRWIFRSVSLRFFFSHAFLRFSYSCWRDSR